jgi:hypothetical protein
MVEVITASIIFLVLFVMTMDTLTRLAVFGRGDAEYVVIENELNKCRRDMAHRELVPGSRTLTYEWGEIEMNVTPYKANIFQVELTVLTRDEKKLTAGYRYLQANP